MTGDPPSPLDDLAAFIERGQRAQAAVTFELAAAELRPLGITLETLRAEYRVIHDKGGIAGARTAETLDEALALGRTMAAERPPVATPARRRRRPLRMTPKAVRRRMIRKHNQRMRA